MKKKILVGLLLVATVVGMAFAQLKQCYTPDQCKQFVQVLKSGNEVTFFNKSNSVTLTVEYVIHYTAKDGTKKVRKNKSGTTRQIPKADSITITIDNATEIGEVEFSATYCD